MLALLNAFEIYSIMSASFDDRFISAVMIVRPIPTQIVKRIIVLPGGETQGEDHLANLATGRSSNPSTGRKRMTLLNERLAIVWFRD